MREVFSSSRFEEIDQIAVEGLDISNAKIYREWNNIDIVFVCVQTPNNIETNSVDTKFLESAIKEIDNPN